MVFPAGDDASYVTGDVGRRPQSARARSAPPSALGKGCRSTTTTCECDEAFASVGLAWMHQTCVPGGRRQGGGIALGPDRHHHADVTVIERL